MRLTGLIDCLCPAEIESAGKVQSQDESRSVRPHTNLLSIGGALQMKIYSFSNIYLVGTKTKHKD